MTKIKSVELNKIIVKNHKHHDEGSEHSICTRKSVLKTFFWHETTCRNKTETINIPKHKGNRHTKEQNIPINQQLYFHFVSPVLDYDHTWQIPPHIHLKPSASASWQMACFYMSRCSSQGFKRTFKMSHDWMSFWHQSVADVKNSDTFHTDTHRTTHSKQKWT